MNRGLESAAGIRERGVLAVKYRVERVPGTGRTRLGVADDPVVIDERTVIDLSLCFRPVAETANSS